MGRVFGPEDLPRPREARLQSRREDAEVHEGRHRRHSCRHHGQEKPKTRSQECPKRAGCASSERGEEGEEGGAEGRWKDGQTQGRQSRRTQGAQGQDSRRKTLTRTRTRKRARTRTRTRTRTRKRAWMRTRF